MLGKSYYRENSVVKVTLVRVIIADAFLAFISLFRKSRTPGPVMVEWHAVLTVLTPESIG